VLRLAARVAGGIVGALAGVAELVSVAASGITAGADRRVHVAVPGVHLTEAAAEVALLEELISEHEGVDRVEVNASLGHVVVTFDPQRLTSGEVARMVEAAADTAGLAAAPRVDRAHPGAAGPLLRESALLAAHLSGLAITTVAAVVPRPLPLIFPATLVAVADASPRVRALVAAALGEPLADTAFTVTAAVANTIARRPLVLITDACLRCS
jgi:hypothetical protein